MLSARYLASCSDDLVKIYSQLESDIICNMAKRLAKLGQITDASEYQAKIYKEIGGLQQDISRYLSKYDTKVQKQIQQLFDEAIQKTTTNDTAAFNAAKRELTGNQKQVLEATASKLQSAGIVTGSKKVREEATNGGAIKVFTGLQRLTMTIASSASNDFIQQANNAYMQVASGAFDYNTALKNSVNNLASRGIHTVEYTDSGKTIHRSIESAVRTNIMTGLNQTASQVTIDNCNDLGTDLVEVSAHIGARPSHAAWQGKIYSLSGTSKKYPPFSICKLGEPDGICGINCRHSYYPYFEGTQPLYSKGELDEYKEQTVKYNDKEITKYEAEQKLRGVERNIRKWKLKADALSEIGSDNTFERHKIYEYQQAAKDLCRQTNIKRDYAREYVGTASGIQPKGLKSATEKFIKTATDTSIKSVSDIKKNDDVVDYFINKYNADTNSRLSFIDMDSAKEFTTGFEKAQKEYGLNVKLNTVSTTNDGIASYTYGGTLKFNTRNFSTKQQLLDVIENEMNSGFFGKDTTPELLGRHELGHAVEEKLIKLAYKSEAEREAAWDSCEIAEKIINKAYSNLVAKGETKSLDNLLKNISGYAATNFSDGLAECLARDSKDEKSLIYEVKRITMMLLKGGKL